MRAIDLCVVIIRVNTIFIKLLTYVLLAPELSRRIFSHPTPERNPQTIRDCRFFFFFSSPLGRYPSFLYNITAVPLPRVGTWPAVPYFRNAAAGAFSAETDADIAFAPRARPSAVRRAAGDTRAHARITQVCSVIAAAAVDDLLVITRPHRTQLCCLHNQYRKGRDAREARFIRCRRIRNPR